MRSIDTINELRKVLCDTVDIDCCVVLLRSKDVVFVTVAVIIRTVTKSLVPFSTETKSSSSVFCT